ncbi:MAG TPA: type II secretion system protein [Gemmatimonadales bacterium]
MSQGRGRGYTLVEILIALVILLVVAGAMHRLLLSTQRLTRLQARQSELQSALRAGALVVANELRELGPHDLLRLAPAAVTYRAMRGVGFLCQTPTPTTLRVARQGFTGHRDPQAGRDTAYVLLAAAESTAVWQPLAVTGVSAGSSCPGAVRSGIGVTVPSTPALLGLEPGTPVRFTEVMELRLYQSDGESWLGARSVSAGEPVQPVIGPLAAGNGLALEYFSGAAIPTSDPSSIRGIRVTLRGQVDGGEREESLTTVAVLRNVARP